jgi:mRNA-degrading endonuclease RelE of RelBE toxin-antitoxin system
LLRLRVGDYRIIFTETLEVLQIENIGHRKEIYR